MPNVVQSIDPCPSGTDFINLPDDVVIGVDYDMHGRLRICVYADKDPYEEALPLLTIYRVSALRYEVHKAGDSWVNVTAHDFGIPVVAQ